MADDQIEIKIVLDDGSVQKGIAKIKKSATKAGKDIDESFAGKIKTNISGIISGAARLAPALAAAFVGLQIRKAINDFREFEKALVGVGKTTGLAGSQLQNFGAEIRKLSTQLPVSTNDLLEISKAAAQFGVRGTQDIKEFTKVIAQLGSATDLVGSEGAQALARLLKTTRGSTKDIGKLGSAITALGNQFETSEGNIAALGVSIGANIGRFGVSSSQAVALGAALNSLGQEAQVSGSALATVFTNIDNAIVKGGQRLADFAKISGKSIAQFKKDFREDSFGAVIGLFEGLSKGGDKNLTAFLTSLGLAEKRTSRAIGVLVQNFGSLQNALKVSTREFSRPTALAEEAAAAFDTLDGDLIKLNSSFTNASATLGQKLAPALRVVVQALTDANNAIAGISEDESIDERIISLEFQLSQLETSLRGVKNEALTDSLGSFIRGMTGATQQASVLTPQIEEIKRKLKELRDQQSVDEDPFGFGDASKFITELEASISEQQRLAGEAAARAAAASAARTEMLKAEAERAKQVMKQLASTIKSSLVGGLSQAFQSVGALLAGGSDAFKNFGNVILGILGDLLIQIGTAVVAASKAITALAASLAAGFGGFALVGGLALIALGGVLKAKGGGAVSAPVGGGGITAGGGGLEGGDGEVAAPDTPGPQKQVQINIEGAIDPRSTAEQVVQLLNDFTDSNDGVIFNTA